MDTLTGNTISRYGSLALIVLASATALYFLVRLVFALLNRYYLSHRDMVWFELTPPASAERSPRATQELFSVIHGFRASRPLLHRLLGRPVTIGLEMSSTRAEGIRYLAYVEKRLAGSFHQAITAYLPQIKVAEIDEQVPVAMRTMEFKETGHYAFPLASVFSLEQHDPVAYLAGAMTKLAAGEQIRFQLIVTPVKLREAEALARKILGNEDMLTHLNSKRIPLLSAFFSLTNKGLFATQDMMNEVYYHGATGRTYYGTERANFESSQVAKRQRPARTLSAFELELMETMHIKLNQPLFRVNIRAGVIMKSEAQAKQRLAAIKTSLQSYSVPSYQGVQTRVTALPYTRQRLQTLFTSRLPALLKRHTVVLSSSELASLYHFPLSRTAQTDNLITSLSRTLPAPVSLKQNKHLDVIVGQNEHHGTSTMIGLTEAERERHLYIIGGTGNGKTTLLQYQIVQDMQSGKGLAVVDPHGDMAETLLRHVPPERVEDVVYFNPDDLEHPIGLNLLELTPGLTGNELLREKDIITESVISVFRKIFSEEDTGGHRIEYVLRNTIQTALTLENPTLFTVFDLLNDTKFRKNVIKGLEDKNLINFWKNELGKAGDMQKVKMAAGITAKIGRFLFSASAKQILEQHKSTIDFDEIINSGKILICNFSKGLLGEDTSELFGITILAKLQLASLRRARIKQAERRPFYLYVDEFQNFATASFVQMLSEARKYKVYMVMAEQSTSQQDDQQMVSIILANVGTVICFRTGNPRDEQLLLPLFAPYIEQGEISNLPSYNFYAKLSAIKPQEPLSGHTLLLDSDGSEEVAQEVVKLSQEAFAGKQEQPADKPKQESEATPVKRSKQKQAKAKPETPDKPAEGWIEDD